MQIIRYQPHDNHSGIGQFELTLAAALTYLYEESKDSPARLPLYRELCSFHYTDLENLPPLPEQWAADLGYVTAELLDRHCAVVYCPNCQTYFTPSQIRRHPWDDGQGYLGRRYTCSQDHDLLIVKDSQYFTFPF